MASVGVRDPEHEGGGRNAEENWELGGEGGAPIQRGHNPCPDTVRPNGQ